MRIYTYLCDKPVVWYIIAYTCLGTNCTFSTRFVLLPRFRAPTFVRLFSFARAHVALSRRHNHSLVRMHAPGYYHHIIASLSGRIAHGPRSSKKKLHVHIIYEVSSACLYYLYINIYEETKSRKRYNIHDEHNYSARLAEIFFFFFFLARWNWIFVYVMCPSDVSLRCLLYDTRCNMRDGDKRRFYHGFFFDSRAISKRSVYRREVTWKFSSSLCTKNETVQKKKREIFFNCGY